MAVLTLENGARMRDFETISKTVGAIGIELSRRPVGDDPELRGLLDKPVLSEDENATALAKFDGLFSQEKATHGAEGWDLVVLHPGVEDLDTKLATFYRCHVHPDDEVRYVIDGSGVFGAVLPDGTQAELGVEAGEYIRVRKGLEHWFRLDGRRRIKCIRIFGGTQSWEAEFTDTAIRMDPGQASTRPTS